MRKINEFHRDNITGFLYETTIGRRISYTFKIFKDKPTKENVVGMSYVNYFNKDKAEEDLLSRIAEIYLIINEIMI